MAPGSRQHGEMKHPWPEQRAKVKSLAIPDTETQRRPEAGKAGAQAQRWAHAENVYPRGESPFRDLVEGLETGRC